jgi:Mg-chelatase subunit ChlD
MNEDNDIPLHPPADEALEARIVAWVLGEASAFEIAELERLCAEKPELAAFHQRMLALQGLLTEAVTPEKAGEWKLSEARTKTIHETFGAIAEETVVVKRKRPMWHRPHPWIGIAACLTVSAIVWRYHYPEYEGSYGALGTGPLEEKVVDFMPAAGGGGSAPATDLKSLAKAIEQQEKVVEERRRTLSNIAREKGIVYSGDQSLFRSGSDAIVSEPAAPAAAAPAPADPSLAASARQRVLPAADVVPPQGGVNAEVRQSLYKAEGNFNLGKYAEAKQDYEAALRVDPANTAARRGLERLAAGRSDYLRAAYDHTRSELRAETDKAWGLKVPMPEQSAAAPDPIAPNPSPSFMPSADSFSDLQGAGGIGQGMGMSLEDAMSKFEAVDKIQTPSEVSPQTGTVLLKSTAIDLDEITTAEEAFSTFSLNVSDVSFQLALDALNRGEFPTPTIIKVEQFYNAVDYGDPAPSGDAIAAKIEQSAHPLIPGRNLVRIGVKTASAGRSAAQPLHLTLLIDQSGSMVRDDRSAALEKSLADLATLLTDKDRVSVIGFSRTPNLLAEGIPGNRLRDVLNGINREAAEAGTNLEEALSLAGQIAQRHASPDGGNRIVLFTDGAANLGDADPTRLADKIRTLRQGRVAFDVAGIGADGLNDKLLAELARNGDGRYLLASGNIASQLAGAFRPAAEDVKVQVRFNPERVSRYKLIGFEEDRLAKEDFRNDAVDAAELASDESAVALYQVELIPDGKGEIGDMSVRFLDTATGERIERSWTMPYDANTPVFDRAAPSMQLAGLTMLAAEKLKGGPMAAAIDFNKTRQSIDSVRTYYPNSSSVGGLLRMIRMLDR